MIFCLRNMKTVEFSSLDVRNEISQLWTFTPGCLSVTTIYINRKHVKDCILYHCLTKTVGLSFKWHLWVAKQS